MSKFCTNCGEKLEEGDFSCKKCGTAVEKVVTPTVTVTNTVTTKPASNGLAMAGFIVSLVSSILCCGSFNVISLILSIIGLVKSKELNGTGKGLAIAGIIISVVFMLLFIILYGLFYGLAVYEEINNTVY